MKDYDGDKIFLDLEDKIRRKEKLTDYDKLNLIFLPLMKSKVNKNEMAINAVELANEIEEDVEKMLYIGAIIGISDKFIDKEYINKLRERLKMTRVGIELKKEARMEAKIEDASNMVKKGCKIEDIMDITGLEREDIQKLYEVNKEKH